MPIAKSFACPGCGQSFDWTPALAGRRLSCACGQILKVPATPGLEVQTYELGDEAPPPGQLAIDAMGQEVAPPQPAPRLQPLEYQRQLPPSRSDELDELTRMRRRDFVVPVALLTAGTLALLLLLAGLIRAGRPPGAVAVNLTIRLGWDVSITFVACLLMVQLIDASFGEIHVAALKIGAMAVARFALWALFGMTIRDLTGDLVGFLLSFILLLWMLSYLLELDFRDTLFAIVLITLIRWISYFGLWKVLP